MKPKIKEILFDAFAVICVLVGFSIHSWPSLCFLLAASICGSFALYFTLLNHRVHGVSETQARNWALIIFAVSLVGAILFWRECKQPTNLAESQPPHADYVEGTEYTQKRLSEIFPFGYVVFFFGQNRILHNEIVKSGMMDWKLDVDSVSINPNFYSGVVTWTIPNVNATPGNTGAQNTVINSKVVSEAPLKKGYAGRTGFMFGNTPVMYVMTLGDNERALYSP